MEMLGIIYFMQLQCWSVSELPSDTKLLLKEKFVAMIIFPKVRISRVIPGRSLSFLEILRRELPQKLREKNNSQETISCQSIACFLGDGWHSLQGQQTLRRCGAGPYGVRATLKTLTSLNYGV